MFRFFRCTFLITLQIFMSLASKASQIDTLQIYSVSMQKSIPCLVVLPADYSISKPFYPVLYLLHGWSGNYSGWINEAPQIRKFVDSLQMMVVCPDGGYDSWYLDSPVDASIRYETHIAEEVTSFIDYYYHTQKDRKGRAIAGISMGGHGAMLLALRHPDKFGAVGSMCGGLDLRPFRRNDWDLKRILGNPLSKWENWEANTVINMAESAQTADLKMTIDCGLGDFFLPVNQAVHQKLLAANVPHNYKEREGEHNAAYWSIAINEQIMFFDAFFKAD
jgi:S-formylglutathione hydrolase FrmB